jgi:hypothetical protein
MKSKLFRERPQTAKFSSEKWVRIFPDTGSGHRLYDPLNDIELGRILVDANDNWIYDGEILDVYEQEAVAAFIVGHGKEMDRLLESIEGW